MNESWNNHVDKMSTHALRVKSLHVKKVKNKCLKPTCKLYIVSHNFFCEEIFEKSLRHQCFIAVRNIAVTLNFQDWGSLVTWQAEVCVLFTSREREKNYDGEGTIFIAAIAQVITYIP